MPLFSRPISVTFENADTGEVFATVKQKLEQLPESFELDTTLHIGEDEWNVVEARPMTRAEYSKTGRLHLRLRRIQYIDPGEILFSLPTIYDALPALGDVALSGNELTLHEDDWRQLEFVSADLTAQVDRQLEAVRLIHQNHWRNPGWDSTHVRSEPATPITKGLTLSDLQNSLGAAIADRGLTFSDCANRIAAGFAFTLPDGLTVYGLAPKGWITVLAIEKYADVAGPDVSSSILSEFARRHDLELVDWPSCGRVAPDHPLFSNVLRGAVPEAEARDGAP